MILMKSQAITNIIDRQHKENRSKNENFRRERACTERTFRVWLFGKDVHFFVFFCFDVVVNLNNLNEEDEQRMEIT